MIKTLSLVVLVMFAGAAGAECEQPDQLIRVHLSAEQTAARYQDYLKLCKLQGGTLIDGQRSIPEGKFVGPGEALIVGGPDRALVERGKDIGPARALIGFVLDETGHVSAVSLAQSSGNPIVDEAALLKVGGYVYAHGVEVDGKPVRAYFSHLVYMDLRQMWHNF